MAESKYRTAPQRARVAALASDGWTHNQDAEVSVRLPNGQSVQVAVAVLETPRSFTLVYPTGTTETQRRLGASRPMFSRNALYVCAAQIAGAQS